MVIETHKLVGVQFGDVDMSKYVVPIEDNLLVTDSVRGKEYYRIPKNRSADEQVEIAVKEAKADTSYGHPELRLSQPGGMRSSWPLWITILLLVTTILLLVNRHLPAKR
jgi:hypothetical protein